MRGAISTLLASPSYDALVIIVGSSGLAQPELMAGAIQACLPLSDKPVLAFVSPHAPHIAALLTRRGVPAYTDPESCSVAVAAMARIGNRRPVERVPSVAPVVAGDWPTGALDEAQAKQLFGRFGITSAREIVVENAAQAEEAARELGGRLVLKVLSAEITHKSDVGGVAVGVQPEHIASRMAQMATDVEAHTGSRPSRFLVQALVAGGMEVIIGVHRDPLGTAILVGMGGVAAELFEDTVMRLLPPEGGLALDEALGMMRELKTWPLLDGFRGRPKADTAALAHAIVAVSNMAAQLGDRLVEAEINPIFVLPEGQGVCAVDGVVVLSDGPG